MTSPTYRRQASSVSVLRVVAQMRAALRSGLRLHNLIDWSLPPDTNV